MPNRNFTKQPISSTCKYTTCGYTQKDMSKVLRTKMGFLKEKFEIETPKFLPETKAYQIVRIEST